MIAIDELVELANRALTQRGLLDASLSTDSVAAIIQVGTSAGGPGTSHGLIRAVAS